jgi:hypothetical protein
MALKITGSLTSLGSLRHKQTSFSSLSKQTHFLSLSFHLSLAHRFKALLNSLGS